MIKKILILALTISGITSICYGQSNEKISALTELATPANDDMIPINDASASNQTKKIRVDTLLGALGGGGDLGADLSSTGDNIFSTTGSVTFDNMTLYADSFVSTGGTISIMDEMTVLESMIIPAVQDCSSELETGEVCIDGNISGLTDSMSFIGADGFVRVNINVKKDDILDLGDGDTFAYDDTTFSFVPVQAAIPFLGGTEGSFIYPLTPATTDLVLGSNLTASADIWLKADAGLIINQNNNDVQFNIQGDTLDYLVFTEDDKVMIGTNTPGTDALLTIDGTVQIEGTGVGFVSFGTSSSLASADPCTSAGDGTVPINSVFRTSGGIICECDDSGVDKKLVDGSACF